MWNCQTCVMKISVPMEKGKTMREKLIELLENDDCPLLYVLGENVGRLADYLIANGVTIPVKCKECFYHHYICPTGFDDRQDDDYCSQGVRDNPWPTKVTEKTMDALNKMGQAVHGGMDG